MNKEVKDIHEEVDIQLSKISTPLSRELNGLFVFTLIFILVIPFTLLKINNNFVLLYYFSNLDLIANILNHWNNYFDNLYFPNPLSEYSFFSSTFINFIALLGISTIVSNIVLKYKNVFYGMAAATTSLLITYLLPTTFIYIFMVNTERYFVNNNYLSKDSSNTLSVLLGIIISFLCILLEVFLSQKYISNLANFYKTIYNIIKKL